MKNSFLIAIAITLSCSAQGRISLGPEIGLNLSNLKMESPGTSFSNRLRTGLRAGINVDIAFGKVFSLQPGLYYTTSGCNMFGDYKGDYFANYTALHNIQVPVYLSYQASPSPYGGLILGAGAFVGYNLSGKVSFGTQSEKLSIGAGKKDNFKEIDFGLGGYLGYKINNGLFFRIQYQYGLANLSPLEVNYFHSRHLAFSLGYMSPQSRKTRKES